jgi:DNA-binding response OmpR family regulator
MAEAKSDAPLKNRKAVLSVESPLLREILTVSLKQAGIGAMTVGTAVDMLREFRNLKPDIIFCEYNTFMIDGVAFIHHLRKNQNSVVPVVMLVPRDQAKITDTAMRAGANAVLSIPFSVADLVATCRKVLSQGEGVFGNKIDWSRYAPKEEEKE